MSSAKIDAPLAKKSSISFSDITPDLSGVKVSSYFSLQKVDPSNTTKVGAWFIIIFGVFIPILLIIVSIILSRSGTDLKPFIIIYVSLFLLSMALWYLIYSVRQYMAFVKNYKDISYQKTIRI